MATMRKCAWFACLLSVVCISGIVAPIPKVDATIIFPPITFPPFPFPFPRSPPPPPPRSPPPPLLQAPPPPPLLQAPPPPPLLQAPPLPPVNIQTLVNINGTIFCTVNGTIGPNASATPVFPNATVQLRCGPGNTVSMTTTDGNGVFSLVTLTPTAILSGNCSLVVATPLSNCNATLPNTTMIMAPLGLPNTTIQTVSVVRFPSNPFA